MRALKSVLRNLVLILMGTVAIGLLVFGPRQGGRDTQLPDDVVIVDYWEKWTGQEGQQLRDIVDQFNRTVGKEKKIFVRCVSTSQISQKTLIATAAGVPPDITGIWDNAIPQLAALDALEPLDELAAEFGIKQEQYKKVYWDNCVIDGKLVALISTPAAVALHINTRLVRENADALRAAGLDPDVYPRTIDELDAWDKALTVKDDSGRIIRSGYLPNEPGWYITHTPFWFGGRMYDESTGKFTFTTPENIRAFEWVQSYSKRLGKDAVTDFRSGLGNFDSPQNAFLAGSVVMVQQGPWMANYIRKLKPTMSGATEPIDIERARPLAERLPKYEWAVIPFPTDRADRGNVTYCPFDALAIPRGAKNKREAFEFIAYVQRQDIHEQLNMSHCKNSALVNVSDEFMDHHPNPYIRVFEDLARSPNAQGVYKVPINGVMGEEITTLIQQIVMLQIDPATGLAAAQERLQEKLDRFNARQRLRGNGVEP